MIKYQKASIDDIDELARIRSIFLKELKDCSEDERLFVENANKAYFESAFADDSFVAWLATVNGKIVATSGLSFSLTPPSLEKPDGKVAYIMNMYTTPEYRKQGLAMELLKRIVEEAKNRGYRKITLNATEMGKPIYEKFGFKDVIGDMVFYAD